MKTALEIADAYDAMVSRTIAVDLNDLRNILHDCIGDTPRYDIYSSRVGGEWWEDRNDRSGEYSRSDDVKKLEERIFNALVEEFCHVATGVGTGTQKAVGPCGASCVCEGSHG